MELDVDTVVIPINFRFGCEYEYNYETKKWHCYAAYYTPKSKEPKVLQAVANSEWAAKERCKHLVRQIWETCVK